LLTRVKKKVTLNFYWPNSSDWTFHFEDPQTLVEQQKYLHSRMHGLDKVDVEVNNIFDADTSFLEGALHSGIENKFGYRVLHNVNTWLFREQFLNVPVIDNLVVIWRTKWIDSKYPPFKDSYDASYWDLIIPILKMKGFNVVEVTHRTPISEVFFLISRCRFVVAYNGMYHYLSKNLIKPMIVLGNSKIIRTHNPQAIFFYSPEKDESPRTVLDYLLDIETNLPLMEFKANDVKRRLYPKIYGKPL
jgi:hypothetical protein